MRKATATFETNRRSDSCGPKAKRQRCQANDVALRVCPSDTVKAIRVRYCIFPKQRDYNFSLRRPASASTMIPEPRSTTLPGSGVVPLPPGPNMSNDSEGIVPTSFDEA